MRDPNGVPFISCTKVDLSNIVDISLEKPPKISDRHRISLSVETTDKNTTYQSNLAQHNHSTHPEAPETQSYACMHSKKVDSPKNCPASVVPSLLHPKWPKGQETVPKLQLGSFFATLRENEETRAAEQSVCGIHQQDHGSNAAPSLSHIQTDSPALQMVFSGANESGKGALVLPNEACDNSRCYFAAPTLFPR
jgi:hypothetical protein